MLVTAAIKFFRAKLRRWWPVFPALVLAGLIDGWAGAIAIALLVLVASVLHAWTTVRLEERALRERLAYVGDISVTPYALTYTCRGKSTCITWIEINSVAFGHDPLSQENQWWLRSTAGVRKSMAIPDYPEIRVQLLTSFAEYLPGYSAAKYDDLVEVISQDDAAVIECWARPEPHDRHAQP